MSSGVQRLFEELVNDIEVVPDGRTAYISEIILKNLDESLEERERV